MGTFAETENVVYRLSFADQGKQNSVFRFLKTDGSWAVYVFRLQRTNRSYQFMLVLFTPRIYILKRKHTVYVSPGMEPGYIVFPSHKTMYICLVRCTAICVGKENF